MATSTVDERRITWKREDDGREGDFVLYWMQKAQRTRDNHALELGIQVANDRGVPVAVVFCLVDDYPEASARHYQFMLEGLADVAKASERRGIHFETLSGQPAEIVPSIAERAAVLVFDSDHMGITRQWREDVISATELPIVEVETDLVVPAHLVSDKKENAARTIRPKIQEHLDEMVLELDTTALETKTDGISLARTAGARSVDLSDVIGELQSLGVAAEPGPVENWKGGQSEGYALLQTFIDEVLPEYADARNRYDEELSSSRLSPYIHYGQVSAMEAARRVRESGADEDHVESFVDELVVRRELAVNFVIHEPDYDKFSGLPEWARTTLDEHRDDEREHVYTADELEAGDTHDEVWNAIMAQIREEGWTHNQLRMYWGKQFLRWTNTPEFAHRTLLELNNRYFLDGRDANSYANVGWCFGLHDQGFQERDVIGKVRPFTTAALKRKGDLEGWVEGRGDSAG